jgi:hypothetical protein
MTIHWLNPTTRKREHAVLACQRITGSHTFDVLAQTMMEIHTKFQIRDKVRRTTTDNASNFIKAFSQFGKLCETLPKLAAETPDFSDWDVVREEVEEGVGVEVEDEFEKDYAPLPSGLEKLYADEDEEEPDAVSVEDILDNANIHRQKSLPPHMRCAAHTLNLIATVDAELALQDEEFKSAYRKAMDKARGFWNAQCRSTVSADAIKQELGRRLVVPNTTRWNSTYDAVKSLNELLTAKRKDA